MLNGAFYSLPYDVLNDFAPISPLITTPFVLFARKTMPAKDLNELIAWLKANPNKASVGVTSGGSPLGGRLLPERNRDAFCPCALPWRCLPQCRTWSPAKSTSSSPAPDQLPLMRAGSIKAYAVTSNTRIELAPDIPTFAEMGLPALLWSPWYGLFAPRGTPRDIIGRLNAAAVEALADPAVRSRLVDLGFEVFPREQQTPEALGALVKADAEKWWPIINQLGISASTPIPPT